VTDGVLFVATGRRYIDAGMRAAATVRRHSPDLGVHLFADWRSQGYDFDRDAGPFTSVAEVENPHRRSKIDYLTQTPFDRTLYLDTDTSVRTDITEMFEILDRFDIALCHAHRRNAPNRTKPWRIPLPAAFPQFNTGVLLYRGTAEVIAFLESWRDAFREARFPQDQVTMRELLWLSDLRVATLPPEYNVRFIKYHYLWTKSEATTKILHLQRYHQSRMARLKHGTNSLFRRNRS
jgi:Nucleotide-diphospho-sugar transferase